MVGTGNGIGSFGFAGGELFSLPPLIKRRRMSKCLSKQDRLWAKDMADKMERGLRMDMQRDLENELAEIDSSMTAEEKAEYDESERREEVRRKFEAKYVLRTDYERDLRLAKTQGRTDALIFCILILPIILIALFWISRLLGFIRPGDFGIG